MRAVLTKEPGGPQVLQLVELPDLQPVGSELLIDVHAAGLNRVDVLQRRGLHPPPAGVTEVLGIECSGIVRDVGPTASPSWLDQRVMCLVPGGACAEQVVVSERMVMKVPACLTLDEAAAVPEAFLTASDALFDEAGVVPGEIVLVHAAAGGVGSAAVQLARTRGARVFATCGGVEKCRWVETLGAERAIDYKACRFDEELLALLGAPAIDIVLDMVGASFVEQNHRVLATRGRWICIGVLSGTGAVIDLGKLLKRRQRLIGVSMRSRSPVEKIAVTQRFVRSGLPLFDLGRLRPQLDRVFPLEAAAEAHAYMEANHVRGKIVLRVSQVPEG